MNATTTATLTSKGQVTIPKTIRESLGLKIGDRIAFQLNAQGRVEIQARTLKARDLYGMLARPGKRKALTTEEMDAAVARSFKGRKA